MPATWTLPQLLLILVVAFVFLLLAFSRSKPITASLVPILAMHYLVINSICWFAFMNTKVWQGGEDVFRFSFYPVLPAASFYIGIIMIIAVITSWISVFSHRHQYSKLQYWSFLAFCLTVLTGLIVSFQTPIAIQNWIDTIQITNP